VDWARRRHFSFAWNSFPNLTSLLIIVWFGERGDCESASVVRCIRAQAPQSIGWNAFRRLPLRAEPVSELDETAARWMCRRTRELLFCLDRPPHMCPGNAIYRLERAATTSPLRRTRSRTCQNCNTLGFSVNALFVNLPRWAAAYMPKCRDLSTRTRFNSFPFVRNAFSNLTKLEHVGCVDGRVDCDSVSIGHRTCAQATRSID
jgi:hypothetical protein